METQLQSSVREIAVLQAATEMILSSADADTVLHQILLIVRNHFHIPYCSVMLVDAAGQELYCRAQCGYDDRKIRETRLRIGRDGISGRVAQNRAPMYIPDVRKEPNYLEIHADVRSEYCIPLLVRDEVIGVLDVESDKLDHFNDQMLGLLSIFGSQAAVALDNARLYNSERRRMRQVEFINLLARSSNSASNLDQLLGNVSELVSDTFEGSEVTILLRDKTGLLVMSAHAGPSIPDEEAVRESAHQGVIGEALSARMNIVVNDVPARAKERGWRPCLADAKSELAVPLQSLGETMGVIVLSHPQLNAFAADDRSIAQASADVCATAIRNVQLSDELRRVANTDNLTGLYNQRYFHIAVGQEISRAKRFNKPFSILMFDLRNFREMNQAHGFDGGDDLLRLVGHTLGATVRAIDTVCRYAGDRFTLILPEIGAEKVDAVETKVRNGLAECALSGKPLSANFSRVAFPADGASELALVRKLLSRLDGQKKGAASA